jgi:NAD(P)-dependent dehydrogenase (short-subunit alcohol dehydrogenase family)
VPGRIDFNDRVAIVTGGGRGIGRAHALALAARGARIVVNDLGTTLAGEGRSSDPAEEVVREIEQDGGRAIAVVSDISSPEGAQEIVDRGMSAFSRVDIVVNNAGLPHRPVGIVEETPADLERQLDVNVRGVLNVTRAAWPHLLDSGSGRVIVTSSNRGLFGRTDGHAYAAAKGALIGVTRSLAEEGIEAGVNVNAICPLAWTRMSLPTRASAIGRQMEAVSPDPDYVSKLVVWLAHESCPVSGEIFSLGMGRYSRLFIGATTGLFDPDATPESLRDRYEEIEDERGYAVPANGLDEIEPFLAKWGISTGAV